ncbi:MAG TPA: hypothetical protein ENK07_09450 [Bacteroidetes bacterium]|nr:hypothetical protein [Bacteroidota bacterium]
MERRNSSSGDREIVGHEEQVFEELQKLQRLYEEYEKMSRLRELGEISEEVEVQLHDWSTPLGLVVKRGHSDAVLE